MIAAALKPVLHRLAPTEGARLALPAAWRRGLVPLLLAATAITVAIVLWLWREQSSYKPVFGAREPVAAADVIGVLEAEHVAYRLHPESGQVLVPEGMLGKVRMLLAAKGVVAKLPAGLELMDHNDPLGVSQFVQDVRFRRGLEGELVQSIMALDAVESARVHLSIAKSTSFVMHDGEKSSASVMLVLKPGRTLGREQIAATINLVAGSVATLDPQRVTLVDQAGNLLSARVDLNEGFEASAPGNEAASHYEEDARRNVRDLLAPVLGDNYKLSVTAEVDNDHVQETREQFGEAPRLTNEAMRQESDRDTMALGVPGSLSNRPVAVASSASEPATTQKSATTRQFAYDRNITQIKRSRGRLQRLNVALLVNSAAAPGGGAWTPEQLSSVERLLRSGLGLSEQRGDKLAVLPMAFPVAKPVLPWWQERDTVVELGNWVGYVVAGLLSYLLVARPLIKLAQRRFSAPLTPLEPVEPKVKAATAAEPAAAASGLEWQGGQSRGDGMVPLLENYNLPPPGSPVDVMVEHLKVLAAKEPERVAEVVKQWVENCVHAE
jgi:flagellar M-ring protein FliF